MKSTMKMAAALCFYVFVTVVLHAADATICQRMQDACVPSQDIRPGCLCALTTKKLIDSDKNVISKRFMKTARVEQAQGNATDHDEIRFEILPQEAIDALNKFFSSASTNAPLDKNVFKNIDLKMSVQLMTLAQYNVQLAMNLNSNEISPTTRDMLINCKGNCEQPAFFHENTMLGNKQNFISDKAIRFDIGNETMIAFVGSTASFSLQNILNHWTEEHCSGWWLWRDCDTEHKYSETIRQFTTELRKEWENFLHSQMVQNFRTHNQNLLS